MKEIEGDTKVTREEESDAEEEDGEEEEDEVDEAQQEMLDWLRND